MQPPAGRGSVSGGITSLANNCHPQWWRDPGLKALNMRLLIVMMSTMTLGYDGSLISGLLSIPEWFKDIGTPGANLLGLVIAAQSFGGIIGFIPASWAMDKFGRRPIIMVGDVMVISAAIGQIFCFNAPAYLGTRLILGVGSVLSLCSGPVLLTELAHPRQRGTAVSLFGTFFFVGAIVSAWVTFGTLNIAGSWSWRVPVVLQVVPASIQLALLFIVPESPRWLIAKDRAEEAKNVLARFHANGVMDDPLVSFEFSEICDTLEREKTALASAGWSAMIKTPGNRKRVALIIIISLYATWSGNGIISYYFAPVLKTIGVTSPSQQAGINGGLQIFNWICAVLGAYMVDRVGRRTLWLTSSCIMLVSMICVTICASQFQMHGARGAGYAVILFLFLFNLGYAIAYTPAITMYIAEMCPYNIRGKGLSLSFMVAFTSSFFNQYVNPVALGAITWKYYLVYVGVLISQVFVTYFFYPETKGYSIEEVAAVFDGPNSELTPHITVEDFKHEVAKEGTIQLVEKA